MMIPTTSIDGVSMPVARAGANLVSDMPLGEVASQVLEQGAAFEAAVEQFQRAMAEIPVLANGTPAPLAPAVAQEHDLPVALPTGENSEAAGRRFPPVGTDPVEVEAAGRRFPPVGTDPVEIEAAGRSFPQVGTDSETKVEDSPEAPVLQAAPVAVAAEPQVIDVKNLAVESVQVVSARVTHQVLATPAQVLIEAASAVADTIVVSPGLLRGAGEVQVQLRPDVLEGTVIHISTASPGTLNVQFTPVTENMAVLLEKCAPQLVTYLSERIHSVQIAVNVKRDDKLKG